MSIVSFLKEQKTHVIYVAVIIGLMALASYFFTSKPKEITKTVTQTKIVDHNIVKTKVQYVDRTIVKKDKDGDVTTTTEHITTDNTSTDKSKSNTSFTSSTTVSYLSRYSLDIQYPVHLVNLVPGTFDAKQLIFTGGYRLFSSPVFVTLGTNVGFDSLLIGVRYEW